MLFKIKREDVSRDHIYSRSEGLKNKIHPLIISHPANCQLVLHSENKKKHGACDITLESLLERIKNFNGEYKLHNLVMKIINTDEVILTDFDLLRNLI
jgi:hypothetical protein